MDLQKKNFKNWSLLIVNSIKGGHLWAPKNQADFDFIQSLDGSFYLGIYRDEDADVWRYAEDDSVYPDSLANWKEQSWKNTLEEKKIFQKLLLGKNKQIDNFQK